MIRPVKPEYEISVESAFFAFFKSGEDGLPVYEKNGGGSEVLVRKADILKKLGITPDVNSKKIYAAGVVYDVTNRVKGASADVSVVAIPKEVADRAFGRKKAGGVRYETADAVGEEFSFGYICSMSDGSKVYYFHPRCKMLLGSENHDTAGDGDIDPEESYKIELMPTEEGLWRVVYFTNDAAEGKKPLTYEQFFGALPYTIEKVLALPAQEQNIGG